MPNSAQLFYLNDEIRREKSLYFNIYAAFNYWKIIVSLE